MGTELDQMPTKAYLYDILNQSKDLSQLAGKLRELEMYKDKGLTYTATDTGEAIVTAQYEIIKERIARENERRANLRAIVQERQEESGFFKTEEEQALKPIDISQYDSLDKLNKIYDYLEPDAINTRAFTWKERYVEKLDDMVTTLQIEHPKGSMDEVIGALDRVRDIVRNLNSEEAITAASHFNPVMDVSVISDETMVLQAVDEILQAWENFAQDSRYTSPLDDI